MPNLDAMKAMFASKSALTTFIKPLANETYTANNDGTYTGTSTRILTAEQYAAVLKSKEAEKKALEAKIANAAATAQAQQDADQAKLTALTSELASAPTPVKLTVNPIS